MKRLTLVACAAVFLFAACSDDKKAEEKTASETMSDSPKTDEKKEQAWIPIDSATGMNAMMTAGAPGEAHKMMAKGNGKWDADITIWMANGAPGTMAKGTSVSTSLFDGRYQQSKFSGNMMGMPFEGLATMAYDNTEKKFVSTWIDNMSTAIMTTTGVWDDASKSMTLTGEQKNPANGIMCTIKEVMTMPDDNHQIMAMYGPDPQTGKEYKMMEIKYTRKK
jgi:hypothetical protein